MKELFLLLESISVLGVIIAFFLNEPTPELIFAILTFLFFLAYWMDGTKEEKNEKTI